MTTRPRLTDALLAAGLGLFAAALTALPHGLAYVRTGSAVWVADHDEFDFYAPLGGRMATAGTPAAADPTRPDGATYYKSLPIAPGVMAARAGEVGPRLVGLAWRLTGGFACGAGWYLFLRAFLGRRAAALAAAFLAADPGTVSGQPGYAVAALAAKVAGVPAGAPLPGALHAYAPQFRILNPVTSLPWWLLYLGLLCRAARRPGWGPAAAAGVALGLLFHIYFYCWTAAGAGLLIALAADRRRARTYLAVGLVGLAVGLPAVLDGSRFAAEYGRDWMTRTDKFVPVSRSSVDVPKVTVALLAAGWAWVFARDNRLVPLAAAATGGLLLRLQPAATGVTVEDFHWTYAYGPALSALLVLMAADVPGWAGRAGAGRAAGWAAAAAGVAAGVGLFVLAVERGAEVNRLNAGLAAFAAHAAAAGPLDAGAVAAGDPAFVSAAATAFDLRPLAGYAAHLAPIPDRELDERLALNAALLGRDRAGYAADQREALRTAHWGPWARSEAARQAKLAERMAAWDAVAADRAAAEDRYGVRYAAVPAGAATGHLGGRWRVLQPGLVWVVWERQPEGGR